LDAIFTSLGLDFIAEIGDKTQLLALMLATRFKRPWPIIGGLVLANLLNHAVACGLGVALAQHLPSSWIRFLVAFCFVGMASGLLLPDEESAPARMIGARNVFLTSLVAFFIAELGDKSQIATLALAARFDNLVLVMIGSTLGTFLADAPVIFLGERVALRFPDRLARRGSAALLAAFGVAVLSGL